MDTSWYLDVNRFARNTPWLHGFMAYYAERALFPVGAGLVLLGVLVLAAWLAARGHPERMPGVVVTAVAALAALGAQHVVAPALGLHHPEVAGGQLLLPRATSYALPDARTAMAGAVVAGLGLSRHRRLAAVALAAALLLAFSRVYTGTDFPSDVAAGLGFGAVLATAVWPVATRLANVAFATLAGGRLGAVIGAKRARPARQLGSLRPSQSGMPNARAMDALRAASEAARHAGGHSFDVGSHGRNEPPAARRN